MSYDKISLFNAFRGPLAVTCGYVSLHYAFLGNQAWTKYKLFLKSPEKDHKRVKFFAPQGDDEVFAADRTVGNTMEQMIPFLSSLWMHAVFVDPATATCHGVCYIAARALYPFVFKMGIPWLFLSTIPNYLSIVALLYPIIGRLITSKRRE